jgi:TATA-binding related factor (TRF) of subunit 20 of Mediator complex
VLWLSKYSDRFFSVVQEPPKTGKKELGPLVVVSMPSQQKENWYTLLTQKMAALWTRPVLVAVLNGLAYDVGEFSVRIGELRQPGNAQAPVRGIVVCIQSSLPTADEELVDDESPEARDPAKSEGASASEVHELLRVVWKTFGVEGAKEAFGLTGSLDGQQEARLWCELLQQLRS